MCIESTQFGWVLSRCVTGRWFTLIWWASRASIMSFFVMQRWRMQAIFFHLSYVSTNGWPRNSSLDIPKNSNHQWTSPCTNYIKTQKFRHEDESSWIIIAFGRKDIQFIPGILLWTALDSLAKLTAIDFPQDTMPHVMPALLSGAQLSHLQAQARWHFCWWGAETSSNLGIFKAYINLRMCTIFQNMGTLNNKHARI